MARIGEFDRTEEARTARGTLLALPGPPTPTAAKPRGGSGRIDCRCRAVAAVIYSK
ncbi:hypothetical protein PO587_02035 [Streptomyces gilvifuscus]|uniref:Uncharacterized protein n=1 Tax=Streptomyces gilvifuscus TaxID=1550617 RepID=A0ABT5FL21_9ACTN|nr:hypothetical protein [Streptomyces gilvifuscus]MDC2953230.1 hypothetical protein [Streptomyces gilvifuscus]